MSQLAININVLRLCSVNRVQTC